MSSICITTQFFTDDLKRENFLGKKTDKLSVKTFLLAKVSFTISSFYWNCKFKKMQFLILNTGPRSCYKNFISEQKLEVKGQWLTQTSIWLACFLPSAGRLCLPLLGYLREPHGNPFYAEFYHGSQMEPSLKVIPKLLYSLLQHYYHLRDRSGLAQTSPVGAGKLCCNQWDQNVW